jgi:hypothetical protein
MVKEQSARAVRRDHDGTAGEMALEDTSVERFGVSRHEPADLRQIVGFRRILGLVTGESFGQDAHAVIVGLRS